MNPIGYIDSMCDETKALYVKLRNCTMELMGEEYTPELFDQEVERELQFWELEKTPENWVHCAKDVWRVKIMEHYL